MQRQKNRMMILIVGCLFMTAFFCGGCAGQSAVEIDMLESGQQDSGRYGQESGTDGDVLPEGAAKDMQDGIQESALAQETDAQPIFVQVNGAVNMPGVYQMEEGGRVFQAIEKAGGLTPQAAPESLNQAAEVTDGQVITVYTNEEWEEIRNQNADMQTQETENGQPIQDGKVNINTADLNTLCTIPGIGQTRAESIISYRNEQGAFEKIEDIKKVSGIKDGLFDKIKDKIKV